MRNSLPVLAVVVSCFTSASSFIFGAAVIAVAAASTSQAATYLPEDVSAVLDEHLQDLNLPELIDAAFEIGALSDELENVGFSLDDEDSLFTDVIQQAAEDILGGTDRRQLRSLGGNNDRAKRFTVEFNGMQVSYPTYVRLTRLQAKVVRLRRMIQLLHQRYTDEELAGLPQYQRLMSLYESLRPLLPQGTETDIGSPASASATNPISAEAGLVGGHGPGSSAVKRSPLSVDFMGMRVSYPQYLRLVALQEKVIRLDKIMRKMRSQIPRDQLEEVPKWHTLVSLHEALRKMLPPNYLAQYQNAEATRIVGNKREEEEELAELMLSGSASASASKRRSRRTKRAANFNGMYVSVPEYSRLMGMQKSALKLDLIMRKMMQELDRTELEQSPKWRELVDLRKSLQKLMPEGHPDFQESTLRKRSMTMDFNGIQVSYPQYLHLVSLQKKVAKLDVVMKKISEVKSEEELSRTPQWKKLVNLRKSLIKLLPMGSADSTK